MGLKLPPEMQGQNIVLLNKDRPRHIKDSAGWDGAIEALEELIKSMKAGLVPAPSAMYVAMYGHDNEGMKVPHYYYTADNKPDIVRVLGLLELHKQKHV